MRLDSYEDQVVDEVRHRIRLRLAAAADAGVSADELADPAWVAEAMAAALPVAHPFDSIAGPFYDTAGLIEWLGITRQAIHRRVQAGSLLACRTSDGVTVYPAFQFTADGHLLPGLQPVIKALRGGAADDWTVAVWLATPADDLDGRSAAVWLADGRDPERPLQAAQADATRWAA